MLPGAYESVAPVKRQCIEIKSLVPYKAFCLSLAVLAPNQSFHRSTHVQFRVMTRLQQARSTRLPAADPASV